MPINATDFANAKNPKLYKKVIETVNGSSPILDFLPFMPLDNDTFKYNSEGALPGISYRNYNEEYPESTGVINPTIEKLQMFGGDSDIDVKQMEANGGIPWRESKDMQKAKAQGLFFTNEFIVGDSQSGAVTRIDGLRTRITGNQILDAGSTNGGDELTLDMLDELTMLVDGETPDLLLMHPFFKLKINRLMRGAVQATEPVSGNFGRIYQTYASIPMATFGSFQLEDVTNPGTYLTFDPLGFNEPDLDDGDQSVTSSIYAINFGQGEYVSGLQCGAFDVEDCGKLPGTNMQRTKLDWMAGLALFHPKSAARLRGLKKA